MPTRTTDLRKRVVFVGAPLAIAVIAIGSFLASRGTTREFARASERQLQATARGAAAILDQYLRERRADMVLLSRTPGVIDAAIAAGADASRRGITARSLPELEAQFAGTLGLLPGAAVGAFLRDVRDSSDLTEISILESHGLTAFSTSPVTQLSRSADPVWVELDDSGWYQGVPLLDDSAETVTLELAAAITDPGSGETAGATRALVDLTRVARLLSTGEYIVGSTVEVTDSTGRVLLSRDATRVFTTLQDIPFIPLTEETNVVTLPAQRSMLAASTPTNGGRWWIVVRQRQDAASNAAKSIQDTIYLASGLALAVAMFLILWLTDWLHRRVTQPVRLAGAVAGRVADGDLSVSVTKGVGGAHEVQRLLESIGAMVDSLRSLVGEIRTAAQESAAMAQQISAATEEMSASTQQMADTCQDLTSQANEQAELTRQSAEDADRILGISASLADGARVAAERSTSMVETAGEHRDRLLQGSQQLGQLATDLERGAADARELADLSEEIQRFVSQAKGISSQTNMLALNAAIEASRASGGGRGFTVVADEVRKLASQTARSAATTGEVVHNVLSTVRQTQERLERLAAASAGVRQIAESAAQALEEVSNATAESSAWSDEIARAANDVNRLVSDITQRLQTIAQGTDSIVTAAEEIAASAEEQSASTEEIAASAAQLADAAQHLTSTVSSFRLTDKVAPHAGDAEGPGSPPA